MAVPAQQTPAPGPGPATRLLLTTAAGGVNAIGYLALGGVFTSVMTANLALLGLALGGGSLTVARLAAVAIAAYLAGAAVGGRVAVRGLWAALAVESVALWASWVLWLTADGTPGAAPQAVLLAAGALAMGCQSGGVQAASGGTATTTAYLTGALTGVVVHAVTAGRLQRRALAALVLLPLGAAAGGLAVEHVRLAAPALPALLVTGALGVAWAGRGKG
ncbi:MAG: DUF1275 family protein [Streptomyces sp.]|nr:DUF1275 family protein [Streptomyces sp.]